MNNKIGEPKIVSQDTTYDVDIVFEVGNKSLTIKVEYLMYGKPREQVLGEVNGYEINGDTARYAEDLFDLLCEEIKTLGKTKEECDDMVDEIVNDIAQWSIDTKIAFFNDEREAEEYYTNYFGFDDGFYQHD